MLAAAGQVPAERARARCAVFGELSLGGELRPCRGALAVAEGARAPRARAARRPASTRAARRRWSRRSTSLGVDVAARGRRDPARGGPRHGAGRARAGPGDGRRARRLDLADVRGHARPSGALTIAAAGGHNLLLSGPPGTGKTMLARRLPSILPPLTREEALEVTRIHSVAGLRRGGGLVDRASLPRAAPHDLAVRARRRRRASRARARRALAHHGVLFLDELAEFAAADASRRCASRSRTVAWRSSAASGRAIFPTRFMLVAATNPCPCGYAPDERCRCREGDLARHRRRLSGPLLDRIDLLVHVAAPDGRELARERRRSSSARERERVIDGARAPGGRACAATGAACNAQLERAPRCASRRPGRRGAERPLAAAYERGALSARGRDRVLRVARTVADLDGSEQVDGCTCHGARLPPGRGGRRRHDAPDERGRTTGGRA